MHILLAEDDALTRFMMSEMLSELDCDFEICNGGDEAVSKIQAEPEKFSLVLMDIHMPLVTGIEATRNIRSIESNPPKEIPIVAVTADRSWHDAKRCADVGFDNVLPKPVSLQGLEAFINRYRPNS